jgi:hypothetical protein
MTPSLNRNLFKKALALALVLAACALALALPATRGARAAASQHADKVSPELRRFARGAETVGVVIQLSAQPSGQLNALLQRNGVRVRGRFASLRGGRVRHARPGGLGLGPRHRDDRRRRRPHAPRAQGQRHHQG